MKATLVIAVFGGLGCVARYWIALWMVPLSRDLPWGTMLINILGSFIISFFGTLTVEHGRYPFSEVWRLAIMVGLCGGFTTFSSFSLQTLDLLRGGATGRALLNIVLSITLCLLAVSAGYLLAERFNGGVHQIADAMIEEEA